ncbi:peptide ABC transporter substrate-binding protein [Streptococcus pantholopis]|uniref:ABC transporter substrate-binding protein n=1 Tax=Streptococcus pantholopis TaxID=1811193 RepID=A0A172Q8V6_9STRE|nr:peptide ABC transporter substrate-binding protein [Streptococcus pantholopis]AND79881.1 ABC transporter substrate-binding protein [Streptococcus pantholopis]
MALNNRLWKRISLGAATLVSAAVLTACGNSTQSSTEINWYTPTEISTLDISKVTDTYSSIAIGNSGGNLLRINEDGEAVPDLAKKVDVSEDGLTYTATLRDDLKWSDGSDLTAEDFVYSWQRIVAPATASEYAYLAVEAHLLNAGDINSGKNTNFDDLGVKADGNKVIFTLTEPAPQFIYYLSFVNFMPQNKDFVEKAGDDYATTSKDSLYSGPYTVEDWNGTSGSFTLVKNEEYWDADNVKTEKINVQTIKKPDTAVQMYKNGELDLANISNTSAIYNANKNNKDVVDVPEAVTSYMVYNQTGSIPALTNTKVRQALNLATDREGIVEAATDTGSSAATAFVPTGLAKLTDGTDLAKYVAPGYKYDADEAAKLFEEGMAEVGQDSLTLTLTADSDNPVAKAAADYIKQTWEEALPGLTVEEKFVTFKQRLEDTKKQNFEVALVLWGGDYPEGSTFYGLFTTDAPYNYGKFSNAEYDEAYNKAITTDALDPDAAAADYKAAEKALYDNALYNPIYFRRTEALQNPDIKGLVRNSTGLSVDFTYAYKDTK